MKGAFGGGFAIVGIPLLSLAMDPLQAGALLAPLFLAMDLCALVYWKPSTWSKPDLVVLLPGLVVGIGLGFLVLRFANPHFVAIAMAAVTLLFTGLWFPGGGVVQVQPRSPWKGALAGTASGITTMVAHSGGPPVAMYLLPLGLSKALYAGTTSLFFTVGNALKAGPWLLVGEARLDPDGALPAGLSPRRLAGLAPARAPRPASALSRVLCAPHGDRPQAPMGWPARLRPRLTATTSLAKAANRKRNETAAPTARTWFHGVHRAS